MSSYCKELLVSAYLYVYVLRGHCVCSWRTPCISRYSPAEGGALMHGKCLSHSSKSQALKCGRACAHTQAMLNLLPIWFKTVSDVWLCGNKRHLSAFICTAARQRSCAVSSCPSATCSAVPVVRAGGVDGEVSCRKWALRMLGVYTCRVENKCLEDIRQRDNAHDAAVLIHHHQSVHLMEDRQTPALRSFRMTKRI